MEKMKWDADGDLIYEMDYYYGEEADIKVN